MNASRLSLVVIATAITAIAVWFVVPRHTGRSPNCTWNAVYNPSARGLRWSEQSGAEIDNWSAMGFMNPAKPIQRGKWVGVVQRVGNGPTSRLFPAVKANDYGCVWFEVDYTAPKVTAVYRTGGTEQGFPTAMYCAFAHGGSHKDDTPPKSVPSNDHCAAYDTVIVSFNDQPAPLDIRFIYSGPADTIQQSLRDSLISRAIPVGNVAALVQRVVAGPGIWFPCNATGCCRVFGA
ncbi:MAG: hypothetical protein U0133_07975 [Gemmatimonadales bacterium]